MVGEMHSTFYSYYSIYKKSCYKTVGGLIERINFSIIGIKTHYLRKNTINFLSKKIKGNIIHYPLTFFLLLLFWKKNLNVIFLRQFFKKKKENIFHIRSTKIFFSCHIIFACKIYRSCFYTSRFCRNI